MAARKSGLGRGLDALIPVDRPASGFAELPIEGISPNPQQPREAFAEEALEELAASIREVGILQPIVVRADEDEGSYTLIAGERRLRAAQLAGIELIPAMIRTGGDDQGRLVEALVENVQREDLSPLEEAAAYSHLMEDFAMTHEQVAQRVGKSRSAVTNTLRLLQLPVQLQGLLERGELSAGHARALLALEDEAYAVHVGQRAAAEGWSVRRVEEAVKARQSEGPKPVVEKVRPAEIIELEQRLAEHLETKVRIDYGKRGGKVIVRFRSLDDLERLYRQLLD
jgi:ParB family chromosome partitioning protein